MLHYLTLMLVFLSAPSACLDAEQANPLPQQRRIPPMQPVRDLLMPHAPSLARLAQTCTQTGGMWRPFLQSCVCSSGDVFFIPDGCQTPTADDFTAVHTCQGHFSGKSRAQIQACVNHFYETDNIDASISLDGLNESEVAQLARTLEQSPTQLLAGVSLLQDPHVEMPPLKIQRAQHMTALKAWGALLRTSLYLPALTAVLDPIANASSFDGTAWAADCGQALESAAVLAGAQHAPNSADFLAICQAAANYVKALNSPETAHSGTAAMDVNFTEEGRGCLPDCALIASTVSQPFAAKYAVIMMGYAPIARILAVEAMEHTSLYFFLSPNGNVQGARLTLREIPERHADALLVSRDVIFDGAWQVIDSAEEMAGSRQRLRTAMTHLLSTDLPTDGANPARLARVNGLLIDTGLDPTEPALRDRLLLSDTSVQLAAHDGHVTRGIFFEGTDEIENSLEIVNGMHGTQVASIMAADLPYLLLSFIRGSARAYGASAATLAAEWVRRIKLSGARVVNLSLVLSRNVGSCERLFDPVFRELPDVLFVAAVGNQGADSTTGTCPAGIANRYENVVTVAGSEAAGKRLHAQSNSGANIAMVAAPFVTPCLDVQTPASVPAQARLIACEGTSMAAPQVSNAALRLLARYPHLGAAQLARIIQTHCKPGHLAVRCGGAVDFAALEAYSP